MQLIKGKRERKNHKGHLLFFFPFLSFLYCSLSLLNCCWSTTHSSLGVSFFSVTHTDRQTATSVQAKSQSPRTPPHPLQGHSTGLLFSGIQVYHPIPPLTSHGHCELNLHHFTTALTPCTSWQDQMGLLAYRE